jgi:imidazolonepropionase
MPRPAVTPVVITGARVMTCAGTGGDPLGLIDHGALVCEGDRIAWVGPEAELPALEATAEVVDLGGRLLTPGLVDCHTHLPFAGGNQNFRGQTGGGFNKTGVPRRTNG